jgi:hypothetical protein
MGGMLSPVKLGRPRLEVPFTANINEPSTMVFKTSTFERFNKNVAGENFRSVLRRADKDIQLGVQDATEAIVEQLESLKHIADEPLSFYGFSDRNVYSERFTTDAALALTLKSSPMTRLGSAYVAAGGAHTDIISIQGVFIDYKFDGSQGPTNYFTAGSYNATTRVVTLGSSPGVAGTVVYVNWRYKGILCWMGDFSPRPGAGVVSAGTPLYDFSINLKPA